MRSHLMIKKFFLRTFVRIMLPIIIPVAVFSSLILFTAVRELYRQEEEEYGQGFELWCASLEEAVNELEWINLTLSTNPAITGRLLSILESADEGLKAEDYPTFDAISELIYGTLTLHSYVDSIYICFDGSPYFLNGNEIDHLPEGEPPLWYETYQQMDPSLPVWTKVYEREQVLSLYRRIYAYGSRHCLGAIVLNIDLDSLRELCDSLEGEKENILYICSAEGLPLFGNGAFYGLQGSSLDSSRYHVETQVMSASGWTIRAAIPLSVLYRAPARLTIMSVIILLGSILLCVLTALSCAYRDSRNMESIITAIEEAKRRNSLPAIQEGEETEGDMKADEGDAYGYILQNTVHAFLHKDYLAMQLAERRHYEKELEYMALRSQLNPHFLFNTLETIRWKTIALSGGENEASSMLENLSDLLRYCLQSEQEEVPVPEELRMTECYLQIQMVRYRNHFTFSFDVQAELADCQIMKFLLQPLIENSISHGIRGKEGFSKITVRGRLLEDHILFEVQDDGLGICGEALLAIQQKLSEGYSSSGSHIGLFNTNKRIRLLYGDAYGITIESTPCEKTLVQIRLPIVERERAAACQGKS